MTLAEPQNRLEELGFLRLKDVLRLYPVSKSTWWLGVQTGRFPKPVKLSTRVTAWRAIDIQRLLERATHEKALVSQDSNPLGTVTSDQSKQPKTTTK